MLLYAFTDSHGDMRVHREVKKKLAIQKPDLIVMAGDFTWFEEDLMEMAKFLNELPAPVLLLPGNHEGEQTVVDLNKQFENIIPIHMARYDYEDFKIFGYGSGGFLIEDPRFEQLASLMKKDFHPDEKTILVLHQPPYGLSIDIVNNKHTGCKSFNRFIKKQKPNLVICGHLHEHFNSQDEIDGIPIVNPGPVGMYFEL